MSTFRSEKFSTSSTIQRLIILVIRALWGIECFTGFQKEPFNWIVFHTMVTTMTREKVGMGHSNNTSHSWGICGSWKCHRVFLFLFLNSGFCSLASNNSSLKANVGALKHTSFTRLTIGRSWDRSPPNARWKWRQSHARIDSCTQSRFIQY